MSWVCDGKVRAETLRVSKMGQRHESAEWVSGLVRQSGSRVWAGDIEFQVGQGRGSVTASGGIEACNGKK